jgi:hypothetical protein
VTFKELFEEIKEWMRINAVEFGEIKIILKKGKIFRLKFTKEKNTQ